MKSGHDFMRMRIGFMRMKFGINAFVRANFMHVHGHDMHELGMNRAWTVHEAFMTVGIKSMKCEQKFPNFMPVARENLLRF